MGCIVFEVFYCVVWKDDFGLAGFWGYYCV